MMLVCAPKLVKSIETGIVSQTDFDESGVGSDERAVSQDEATKHADASRAGTEALEGGGTLHKWLKVRTFGTTLCNFHSFYFAK